MIYILVTVIASMAVPTGTLADSDGPLLEVVQIGPLAMSTKVFSAIALFALANGALINLIMASRLVYGMSREGILPRFFGRVHAQRRTPYVAIVFTALIAMALVRHRRPDRPGRHDRAAAPARVHRREHLGARPAPRPRAGTTTSAPRPSCRSSARSSRSRCMTTKDADIFLRAGALLVIGVLLWLVTWYTHGRHQPAMDTGVLRAVKRPE